MRRVKPGANRARILSEIAKLQQEIEALHLELRTAHCTYCGREFVYERVPPDLNNWPCCGRPKCIKGASIRRVKVVRDLRQQLLLDLAVKYWPHWTGQGDKAEWLAFQINAAKRTRAIQKNWVSRHQQEIEQRAGENSKSRHREEAMAAK